MEGWMWRCCSKAICTHTHTPQHAALHTASTFTTPVHNNEQVTGTENRVSHVQTQTSSLLIRVDVSLIMSPLNS